MEDGEWCCRLDDAPCPRCTTGIHFTEQVNQNMLTPPIHATQFLTAFETTGNEAWIGMSGAWNSATNTANIMWTVYTTYPWSLWLELVPAETIIT